MPEKNESAAVSLLFISQENTLIGFCSIALGVGESLGPAGVFQTRAILYEINLRKACMYSTEPDYRSSVEVLFCNIIVQLIASPKGPRKNITCTWKTVTCQYVPGNVIFTLIYTRQDQEQFGFVQCGCIHLERVFRLWEHHGMTGFCEMISLHQNNKKTKRTEIQSIDFPSISDLANSTACYFFPFIKCLT